MATGSSLGEQRIFNQMVAGVNDNAGQTGTQNIFVKVGGIADQTGTRVADGDEVTQRFNRFGHPTPERAPFVIGSLTSAGATTTASLGSVTLVNDFKSAFFLVNVIGTAGSTATLTVYVDSKLDGTNYSNIAAGAVMTTASQQGIFLTKYGTANFMTALTGEAGAGTIRNVPWADDLQVRYTISGATSSITFTVFLTLVG